ncbi:MAG: DUF4349 domain-containing protein [Acidobacteria bacterium]|nr:DUF4349 domain-containing protein [Acidobacteriota bacterium]
MARRSAILSFFLLFMLLGCAKSDRSAPAPESTARAAKTADEPGAMPAPPAEAPSSPPADKTEAQAVAPGSGGSVLDPEAVKKAQSVALKLIKTGNLRMRVDKYAEARAALGRIVAEHQGYISQEREETTDTTVTGDLAIRVDSARFDALVEALVKLGAYVHAKNVNVKDVTEEYVDVAARLKAKREVEAQYLQILKQAKNVRETLDVEQYLRQIQEEIEAAEGRLRYLDNQISLSTLQVSMYENLPGGPKRDPQERGFFGKLWDAFGDGWDSIKRTFIGEVRNWPGWVIFLVLVWVGVKVFKRMRKAGHFKRREAPAWIPPTYSQYPAPTGPFPTGPMPPPSGPAAPAAPGGSASASVPEEKPQGT